MIKIVWYLSYIEDTKLFLCRLFNYQNSICITGKYSNTVVLLFLS